MLVRASERLQSCQCTTLPVLRGDRLIGLLTTENLGEFVMIREALERAGDVRLPPAGGDGVIPLVGRGSRS
jgi:hypothetical protein